MSVIGSGTGPGVARFLRVDGTYCVLATKRGRVTFLLSMISTMR